MLVGYKPFCMLILILLVLIVVYGSEIEDIEFETSLLEKQLEFAQLELQESRARHERDLRKAAIARVNKLAADESSKSRRHQGSRRRRRARIDGEIDSPTHGQKLENSSVIEKSIVKTTRIVTESRRLNQPQYLWDGSSKSRPRVVVLVYNKIRGYLDWLREDFVKDARNKCSSECIFTADRRQLSSANVIVFHAVTHSMHDFPRAKGKFLLVSLEQGRYAKLLNLPRYTTKFDATATFRLDSTLPMLTIPPHWDADAYYKAYDTSIPWHQKLNAAVAFVSNCRNAGAQDRLDFLGRLSRVYEIHSYGRCLHNKDEPSPRPGESRSDLKRRIVSKYKFYLALENNIDAKDYVSEKVFEGLLAGSLPIYRGTDTVAALLPAPDAILNTRDYQDDAQKIANRLSLLAKDESAYATYFQWRQKPNDTPNARAKFQKVLDMTAYKYTALCRICAYAANST